MTLDPGRTPVIVDIARTPVGRAHKGTLVENRPDDLGAFILRALLERNPRLDPAEIEDVVCGCAFPWGEQGYNVGRCITVLSGLPHSVPAQTITRLCASSLQALRSASHAIALGEGGTFAVVGVESVSRVGRGIELAEPNPLLDPEAEGDLLGAVFMPMGLTAEYVADDFGISREEMDAYAERSQNRALAAQESGFSAREIVPVPLPGVGTFDLDECPRPGTTIEKLAMLQPVFRPDGGRVTAGNSCPLNDGAAAALVMSAARAEELGLQPRARIISSAVSAVDPSRMGIGPIEAIKTALERAEITIDDLDIFELNEAFAAQVIPVCNEVGLDPYDDRVNRHGGAIAIGHPFGMTGLRIMSTLLNGLDECEGRFGLETMCVGGGQGQAMIVERLAA